MNRHIFAALTIAAALSVPLQARADSQKTPGYTPVGSNFQIAVVDARNKFMGLYLPGTAAQGAVVIDLGDSTNIFALSTVEDRTLRGSTFNDQVFFAYTQPGCGGTAYIIANESLPIGFYDGTNNELWYASRPLERQTIVSENFNGDCIDLDPSVANPTLVGKAISTTLAKLGFRTPFLVRPVSLW